MTKSGAFYFVFSLVAFSGFAQVSSAQETTPVTVPEKAMASRLLSYPTPKLIQPTSSNRCSNAMAIVHAFINEDGTVRSVEYASGYSELKEAALAAVRQWIYKPYQLNGRPVSVDTKVSIFYLGDGSSLPMYTPDGKGGVKGGNMIMLPAGCGSGPQIKRQE